MAVPNIVYREAASTLEWDPLGTPLILGPTQDVTVTVTGEKSGVGIDGVGGDYAQIYHGITECKIAIDMLEMDLTRLALLLGVTIVGLQHQFSASTGSDLRESAKWLYIKPFINGATVVDKSTWCAIPLCTIPMPMFSHKFKVGENILWHVESDGLPYTATGYVAVRYFIGENV